MMDSDQDYELAVFLVPRLASFAGYHDVPLVYAVMFFFLPAFTLMTYRFVHVKTQFYELWSPNSRQKPYYAGLPDPNFKAGRHLKTQLRRCDGHTGRFDPTVSPQHFVTAFPWFGYIRRDSGKGLPEFEIAAKVWKRAGSKGGYFTEDFLYKLRVRHDAVVKDMASTSAMSFVNPEAWAGRPIEEPREISTLNLYLSFDEATDLLADAQKSIKYFDAWNRYAEASIRDYENGVMPIDRVEEADDSLVGTWLNGADETSGIALLRHRVPCFIIGQATSPRDIHRAKNALRNYNFVSSSDILRLSKDTHRADRLVATAGGQLDDLTRDLGLAKAIPAMNMEDIERASSTAQGYIDPYYTNPQVKTAPMDARRDPSTLNSVDSPVNPPAVCSPSAGKWSWWHEGTLDDSSNPCLIKVGGKNKNSSNGYRFFDRELRRYLVFDEKVNPPDNYRANVDIFGLPVPKILFMERENNKDLAKRRPSAWMYKTERPVTKDIGRLYVREETAVIVEQRASPERSSRSPSVTSPTTEKSPVPVPQNTRSRSRERTRRFSRSPSPERYEARSSRRYWKPRGDYYRPRYDEREHSRESRHRSRSASREYNSARRYEERNDDSRRRNYENRSISPSTERDRNRYSTLDIEEDWMDVDIPNKGKDKDPAPCSPRRSPSPSHNSENLSMCGSHPNSPNRLSTSYALVPHAPAVITTQLPNGGENVSLAVASTSSAIIPYMKRPNEESLQSLNSLFPALEEAPMDVRDVIARGTRTKFLAIWNFPVYFLWKHVVEWVLMVLDDLPKVILERVLRTNQDGNQVFWLKFNDEESATSFRGTVSRRRLWPGGQYCYCDFIINSDYAGANGRSSDFWQPEGLSHGRELEGAAFNNEYCSMSISAPSLRQRLGLPPLNTPATGKPSKAERRRMKEAALLGISLEELATLRRKPSLASRLGPSVENSRSVNEPSDEDNPQFVKRRRTHL
ncbi:hypothetical protein HYPSUDRAFT_55253 [Hypholoma sublateritium FD-334 SS-4]|uniref:Uncharacterized protein n=1 Tax=Hypholoma sublateritium (strain FD-334 SS-4) TaxID=945553 RepID=A0A0D2NSC7_HYPSF|nr:hypothetical protein HYPSUDRAFT_55253 [Hypholoma sublateritium FD-334 SS-4]